ncbi:MAG: hypothetical protein AB8G16_07580 [Gammaproteobacteria bacterium]
MKTLQLEMLPAAEGDALLLSYGRDDDLHYVLIDGGRRSTYPSLRERILALPLNADGKRFFELLIVTHIDADHIEGIIGLLQDDELECEFGDIWFNDFQHLEPLVAGEMPKHLGAKQGEFLGALLHHLKLPWNESFNGGAVVLPPEPHPLPSVELAGGLKLTLVSPSIESLIKLRKKWNKVIEAAGFVPGDRDAALTQFGDKAWTRLLKHLGTDRKRPTRDHSEANGSSIGVVAEFGGHRLLLSGDAWAQVLQPALLRFRDENDPDAERVALDAFKLPHHGSKNNINAKLMASIDCPRYLISTSGSRFRHPDVPAIETIMDHHHGDKKPELWFNYTSDDNGFWARESRVDTRYGDDAIFKLDIDDLDIDDKEI